MALFNLLYSTIENTEHSKTRQEPDGPRERQGEHFLLLEDNELFEGVAEIREDIPQNIEEMHSVHRNRRSRKIRYRKVRFNNRKRPKGWLTPTMRMKYLHTRTSSGYFDSVKVHAGIHSRHLTLIERAYTNLIYKEAMAIAHQDKSNGYLEMNFRNTYWITNYIDHQV